MRQIKSVVFIAPMLLFAGLVWLFSNRLSGPPPSQLPSPLIGRLAPTFSLPGIPELPTFSGRDLSAGHSSVVNFWASWCAPCRVEHSVLEALGHRKSVFLYGIAWKNKEPEASAFLRELGNPFARVAIDQSGRVGIDWGLTGVPETFVVDGHGIVRAHFAGPLTPEALEKIILPALEEQ